MKQAQLISQSLGNDITTISQGNTPVLFYEGGNSIRYAVIAINFLRSGSKAVKIICNENTMNFEYLEEINSLLKDIEEPPEQFKTAYSLHEDTNYIKILTIFKE